ncbi:hypothetical protein DNU24_00920 [Salmonella enterica subsp. salamae]|uniref:Uncharacterized protein n=1 Tax=Salmonella enterica subsp. salamae TaxID=59202 RepID=A0A5Y3X513_SALER|nr:hypothetical protein [Salmonella enterica subsp. salamae]ECJ4504314.1 hypothetical protein [Salmonella enterica subsp. salamae]MII79603.1 hypothetical protein [Salmonella enterica subsp. salamae]
MPSKGHRRLRKSAIRCGKVGDDSSPEPLTNRFMAFLPGGAALNLPVIIAISINYMMIQAR